MSTSSSPEPGSSSELQLENEFFRVVQWTIEPGGHIPMHEHEYEYVVTPLMNGVMHVENEDGTEFDAPLAIGKSYSRGAGATHEISNRSETDTVVFVEVERLR